MSFLKKSFTRFSQFSTPTPKAFLGPIFPPEVQPFIATGFEYSQPEIALHGVQHHGAIDFDVPRETPILAPASGYAMCTYGEVLLRDKDGKPRQLDRKTAQSSNPRNTFLNYPEGQEPWPVYFGSYVIQIWHENGYYTQYAHVDKVSKYIPYHEPVIMPDIDDIPPVDLQHSPALRVSERNMRNSNYTRRVTKGETIGWTGMTGCGWGRPCYNLAKFEKDGRPNFTGIDYPYYTGPHLHFMVFGPRAPITRIPKLFDPFGLYNSVIETDYPTASDDWSRTLPMAKHHSLWL